VKKIATATLLGCATLMLSGCVKQEEYDAKVTEAETLKKETVSLQAKLADQQALLEKEKEKAHKLRTDLGDVTSRLAKLQKEHAKTAIDLADQKAKSEKISKQLTSATASAKRATEDAEKSTAQLSELREKYEVVKQRLEQLERNLKALSGIDDSASTSPAIISVPKNLRTEAPAVASSQAAAKLEGASDLEVAKTVLNEMSAK